MIHRSIDAGPDVVREGDDQALLEEVAYQSWIDRGSPIGSPEVDWHFACQWLQSYRELEQGMERLEGDDADTIRTRMRSNASTLVLTAPDTLSPNVSPVGPKKSATGKTAKITGKTKAFE